MTFTYALHFPSVIEFEKADTPHTESLESSCHVPRRPPQIYKLGVSEECLRARGLGIIVAKSKIQYKIPDSVIEGISLFLLGKNTSKIVGFLSGGLVKIRITNGSRSRSDKEAFMYFLTYKRFEILQQWAGSTTINTQRNWN